MRKFSIIFSLVVAMSFSSLACAGERAGAFSISPYLGGYVFDDVQQSQLEQNRLIYGLRLGYDFTDRLAAELVGSYVRGEYKADDHHLPVWGTHLDLLYNFIPQARVVPYLAIGGGLETARYRTAPQTPGGDETDATMNVGAGLKFFMTDDLALRLDARHIFDYPGGHGRDTIHNWEYSLGMSFLFGGAKAATTAAAPSEKAPTPETGAAAQGEAAPLPVPAAEPTAGHYKYCETLDIEFDIDRAQIRPGYNEEIAKVCDFMQKYPTTSAVIEGHTDNVGTAEHNLSLSQRRAEAVVAYLEEKCKIDPSRLSAKGYGMTRPVADNSTDEGRQKNRRINAIIDCVTEVREVRPPERFCMHMVLDFDSGKAEIQPQYRSEIAKVADYLKQYPTTTAVIEGHTDNTGGYEANMKLSQQRAENVVNYLVENFGIDRSRLSAKGYGPSRQIAYNTTPEGRSLNRRINAIIDCVVNKPSQVQ